MVIVIMGVTGCGKTTVGELLAARLGIQFLDADNFHHPESIQKMSNGIALTDEDRYPWLEKLSVLLKEYEAQKGIVLACSALKNNYRNILQSKLKSDIIWILLEGPEELILERLKNRKNHFMSSSLLQSQFEAFETPLNACNISIEKSPEHIVEEIIKVLK